MERPEQPKGTSVSGIEQTTVGEGKKVKTVYVLEVETDRGVVRRRYRYSEFFALYHTLKEKDIPGFPTSFPAKKLFHSAKTLEKRRMGFQRFMAQLLSIPDILFHEELRSFLGLRMVAPDGSGAPSGADGDGMGALRSKRFVSNTAKFRPRRRSVGGSSGTASGDAGERPAVPERRGGGDGTEGGEDGGGDGRPRGWSQMERAMDEFESGVAEAEERRAAMAPLPPPMSARASRIVSAAFISDLDAQLEGGGPGASGASILGIDRAAFADLLDGDDDDDLFDITDPSFDVTSDDDGSFAFVPDTSWSGIGPGLVASPSVDAIDVLGGGALSDGDSDSARGAESAAASVDGSRAAAYEAFLHTVPLPGGKQSNGVLELVAAFAEYAGWPNANSAVAEEFGRLPAGMRRLDGLKAALAADEDALPAALEPQLALFLGDVAFRTDADVAAWSGSAASSGQVERPRRASSILRSSVVTSLHRYLGAFESASRALGEQVAAQSLPSIRDLLSVVVDAINGAAGCLDELADEHMMDASTLKRAAAAVLLAARPVFADDGGGPSGWDGLAAALADLAHSVAALVHQADTFHPLSGTIRPSPAAGLALADDGSHSRLIDPQRITRVRLLSTHKAALKTA